MTTSLSRFAALAGRLAAIGLVLLVAGCAGEVVRPYTRPPAVHAAAPRDDTAFAPIERSIRAARGADTSGFELLDRNEDGLRWRLALIDSATHTIDAQYYLWYGDAGGRLLVERLLEAADRGVKVRLLLDDLNTLLSTAGEVKVRDDVAAWLDAHPNLELRLFNPWRHRSLLGRLEESVAESGRVNHRMHNKVMIVDNQAMIIGGRNIGDEYLGLNEAFNFHDLDVIGVGPVARQASTVFDQYWNSDWVMPAVALRRSAGPAGGEARARRRLADGLAHERRIERFPLRRRDWGPDLAALAGRLHPGTSRVTSDVLDGAEIRQDMVETIYELSAGARREILISNAYIIPDERTIAAVRGLQARGVRLAVLTNSLATHDVPAVNSHYGPWRTRLIEAGVELHEMRHDAAIQADVADTPPTRAGFMGLHVKAMVVDRERVYIGSMNFDPRSAALNTEMGVIVDSPGLGRALGALIERDLLPQNSWRVRLDDGRLTWTNDHETVTRQPARSFWQRVQDVLFKLFPRELY